MVKNGEDEVSRIRFVVPMKIVLFKCSFCNAFATKCDCKRMLFVGGRVYACL